MSLETDIGEDLLEVVILAHPLHRHGGQLVAAGGGSGKVDRGVDPRGANNIRNQPGIPVGQFNLIVLVGDRIAQDILGLCEQSAGRSAGLAVRGELGKIE